MLLILGQNTEESIISGQCGWILLLTGKIGSQFYHTRCVISSG